MQRTLRPSAVRAAASRRRQSITAAAVEACEPRRLMASISGVVYRDFDADGTRDSGDTGLVGVTLFLDKNYNGALDSGERSTRSYSDGSYRFDGLVADGKSVGIALLNVPRNTITSPAGGSHSVKFLADYAANRRDFGLSATPTAGPGSVSGYAYFDANHNGARDAGEHGYGRVYLDINNDAEYDGDEPFVQLDLWDDGHYEFTGLATNAPVVVRALSYEIYGTNPTIWLPGNSTYAPASSRYFPNYAVTPTVAGTTVPDFARTDANAGLVYVSAYYDRNGSGAYERGIDENAPLDGGWLELDGVAGQSNVEPPLYSVAENPTPANPLTRYTSIVAAGVPHTVAVRYGGDSSPLADATRTFTVPGDNQTVTLLIPVPTAAPQGASVSGIVFSDTDGNGQRDFNDAALANTTVYADVDYDGVLDAGEPRALTNASGEYTIAGIPVGKSVAIRLANIAASRVTSPAGGAYALKFNSAYGLSGRGFGVAPENPAPPAGAIWGTVYAESNGSPGQGEGEPGIGGLTVYVDDNNNGVLDANEIRAVTRQGVPGASDGFFKLENVPPGTRRVRIAAGTNSNIYAEGTSTVNVTANAVVFSPSLPVYRGQSTLTFGPYYDANKNARPDAGDSVPAFAQIWLDLNRNGRFDNAEPPLEAYPPANGDDSEVVVDRYYVADGSLNELSVAFGSYQIAYRLAGDTDALADGLREYVLDNNSESNTLDPLTAPAVIGSRSATVSGAVFADRDADGVRDAGEPGLAGRLVFADDNFNGTFDSGESIAATDAGGNYALAGVRTDGLSAAIRLVGRPGNLTTAPSGGYYSGKFATNVVIGGRNFGVAGA